MRIFAPFFRVIVLLIASITTQMFVDATQTALAATQIPASVTIINGPTPTLLVPGDSVNTSVTELSVSADLSDVTIEAIRNGATYDWSTEVLYKSTAGGSYGAGATGTHISISPSTSQTPTLTAWFDNPGYYQVKISVSVTYSDGGNQFEGTGETTVELKVVGISKIQYSDGTTYADVPATLYVMKGTNVTFKAIPNPTDATSWPSDKPFWGGTSGATGTGETKAISFSTVSTSSTDSKTVTSECGNTATANVICVELDKLQYKLDGAWTDCPAVFTNIGLGTGITFKAIPKPADASWPNGFPTWGGEATGIGSEKNVTFSTKGSKTVSATCGTEKSVNVAVDDVNGTVSITWPAATYSSDGAGVSSTTVEKVFVINYEASADVNANKWMLRLKDITGGATIEVHTGGSRDPGTSPPTTQADAADAVTVMKGYYARGTRGTWHTEAASKAHEEYHYLEWRTTADHYWPVTETALESITAKYSDHVNDPAGAVAAMKAGTAGADAKIVAFSAKSHDYWFTLDDNASSRPYAAGQLTLNTAITAVQALAATNGWTVAAGTDSPSTANPCYQPWLPYAP